ncbi:MAG: hypothetical protein EOM66_11140 [Clostridia bacterium]|nr:hypothetical protein [Clostridia bacterium]
MAFSMERWHSATQARFSARRYKAEPEEEEMAALTKAAARMGGRGVRIALGESDNLFKPMFLWYGRITGASRFAAFIAGPDASDQSIGYFGEPFILEATALGIGTCWVGASYQKGMAKTLIPLQEGERIVAVTPLGISAQSYVGRPRKSLEELTGLSQEALQALPDWQQSALSCARLAPSAVNRQPWRFIPNEKGIELIQTGSNFGYGGVDLGIAMLHIELGAAHCSVSGTWQENTNAALFVPDVQVEA